MVSVKSVTEKVSNIASPPDISFVSTESTLPFIDTSPVSDVISEMSIMGSLITRPFIRLEEGVSFFTSFFSTGVALACILSARSLFKASSFCLASNSF